MAGIESFPGRYTTTLDFEKIGQTFRLVSRQPLSLWEARGVLKVIEEQSRALAERTASRPGLALPLNLLRALTPVGLGGAMIALSRKYDAEWTQGFEDSYVIPRHWEIPANYTLGLDTGHGWFDAPPVSAGWFATAHGTNPAVQYNHWGYSWATPIPAMPNAGVDTPAGMESKRGVFGPSGQFMIVAGHDDHPSFGNTFVRYQHLRRYDKVSGANTGPTWTPPQTVPAVPATTAGMTSASRVGQRTAPQSWLRHLTTTSNGLVARPRPRARARSFTADRAARNVPPGRLKTKQRIKERHKKFIANPATWHFIRAVFDIATEWGDAIDALYESLPSNRKHVYVLYRGRVRMVRVTPSRNLTLNEKMRTLWRYRDEFDVNTAVENLFWNEVEDRLFGKIGQTGAKAIGSAGEHGYTRSPVGLQTGPVDNAGSFRPI